ncbi:MAG: hypothetical protein HY399_02850, partial [Elusimicrobia bacterium]|nr:hypothetical protein [Elusimicrobiota bacterium]
MPDKISPSFIIPHSSFSLFDHLQRFFLLLACFVCPLLFYTDLTRNPYFTQIAVLNICILFFWACWLLRSFRFKKWEIPRTPLDMPWLAWLLVCGVSLFVSYLGHPHFFRPAILSEGFRVGVFTFTNTFLVYYWGATVGGKNKISDFGFRISDLKNGDVNSQYLKWSAFIVIWSSLWFLFPALRSVPQSSGILNRLWDGYGGLLWLGGLWAAWRLTRRGSVWDYWHLLLAVGFFASGYGILQYLGVEIIWPNQLDPYGGRAVSTFGNPNFLSSYLVVLLPLALVFFLKARSLGEKCFYGVHVLLFEASLICSLTRSSWLGAGVAIGCLFLSPSLLPSFRENKKSLLLLGLVTLLMVFLWPGSRTASMTVLGRITELKQLLPSPSVKEAALYSPWHQRLLIWVSCWQMGLENPIFGKGWGLLELFYPFYQGPNLLAHEFLRGMRT